MIVQVRICIPAELSDLVVESCTQQTGAAEMAVHKGASIQPPGDVVVVHVARESVEELLEKLHVLRCRSWVPFPSPCRSWCFPGVPTRPKPQHPATGPTP